MRHRVGWNSGAIASRVLRLTFKDALHRVRLTACVPVSVLLRVRCRSCSLVSFLSWGSQRSSLHRHTHQESTPTTPLQQAEGEGFGQGRPRPRLVPPTSFLTTSAACSSWALRACFSPQPTMGFITFQAGSCVHLPLPAAFHTTHPHRILDTFVASASRQATRGLDLSSHRCRRSRSRRSDSCVLARILAARSPAVAGSPGRLPKESTCVLGSASCLASSNSPALTRSLLPRLPRFVWLLP